MQMGCVQVKTNVLQSMSTLCLCLPVRSQVSAPRQAPVSAHPQCQCGGHHSLPSKTRVQRMALDLPRHNQPEPPDPGHLQPPPPHQADRGLSEGHAQGPLVSHPSGAADHRRGSLCGPSTPYPILARDSTLYQAGTHCQEHLCPARLANPTVHRSQGAGIPQGMPG